MSNFVKLPPQQLPFNRKNKKWRKLHCDWADSKTFFNYSPVRNSVIHKKINYDLINGKLHMSDLMMILNPEHLQAGFIPDKIQHYPIMNSKLDVLRGEESARVFDYRVVITNPNSISEIENNKRDQIYQELQKAVQDTSSSDEEFNQRIQQMGDYFSLEWQDIREIRANSLLHHYIKELNMPLIFNQGFMDGMTVGEEIYQCDIVGGEPVIERINPLNIRAFRSGYSNRLEDADIIILEDYWSPGKIIDTYYDVLTEKDRKYIEQMPDNLGQGSTDSMDNIDERYGFVNGSMLGETFNSQTDFFSNITGELDGVNDSLLPFDMNGNIRVLRVYWKSRRKIKKVKSYDPETGEEVFNFYPETYITKTEEGEEETVFYINEAWEGTKIGTDIYVNMRPRVVQYNRLSNPSRCHFGIIGSIYNLNDSKPFSLVDKMKSYNYLYDVIHDRLNKLLARNWGVLVNLDLAKVPTGWDIEKWMYFARTSGIVVTDSFKEGNSGASMGKLSGALNNAQQGAFNADVGNTIQQYVNLLEYIKQEMTDVSGISRQREGQISNRETVGGVERATLQSSHITEWLFMVHDDVKKRALECFLETAKIALKGRSKKFQYLLADNTLKVTEIDGDEFAESDYGLVVDNSDGMQELKQKLDMLAQAALQNQTLNFSTIMKLYNSTSLAEKQRMVEKNEQDMLQRAQEQQQQQQELAQQQIQQQAQQKQAEMELKDSINQRDNETRILVAEINAESMANQNFYKEDPEQAKAELAEKVRQFNSKQELEKDKLAETKRKNKADEALKLKQINKPNNTSSK